MENLRNQFAVFTGKFRPEHLRWLSLGMFLAAIILSPGAGGDVSG
jgi:hypothetical protein